MDGCSVWPRILVRSLLLIDPDIGSKPASRRLRVTPCTLPPPPLSAVPSLTSIGSSHAVKLHGFLLSRPLSADLMPSVARSLAVSGNYIAYLGRSVACFQGAQTLAFPARCRLLCRSVVPSLGDARCQTVRRTSTATWPFVQACLLSVAPLHGAMVPLALPSRCQSPHLSLSCVASLAVYSSIARCHSLRLLFYPSLSVGSLFTACYPTVGASRFRRSLSVWSWVLRLT